MEQFVVLIHLTWRNWSAMVSPPRLLSKRTAPEVFLITLEVRRIHRKSLIPDLEAEDRLVGEHEVIENVKDSGSLRHDRNGNLPPLLPGGDQPHPQPLPCLVLHLQGDGGEVTAVERLSHLGHAEQDPQA